MPSLKARLGKTWEGWIWLVFRGCKLWKLRWNILDMENGPVFSFFSWGNVRRYTTRNGGFFMLRLWRSVHHNNKSAEKSRIVNARYGLISGNPSVRGLKFWCKREGLSQNMTDWKCQPKCNAGTYRGMDVFYSTVIGQSCLRFHLFLPLRDLCMPMYFRDYVNRITKLLVIKEDEIKENTLEFRQYEIC